MKKCISSLSQAVPPAFISGSLFATLLAAPGLVSLVLLLLTLKLQFTGSLHWFIACRKYL